MTSTQRSGFIRRQLQLVTGVLAVAMTVVAGVQIAPMGRAQSTSPAQSAVHARNDIADVWQGTSQTPQKSLRVVLKIAKADKGWSVSMYSINQGAYPIKSSSVSLDGSAFKCAADLIGGNYQGTLSADGNSIAGSWTHDSNPIPLTLVRATTETARKIPVPPPPRKLMAAGADPSFDVVTIKPNGSGIGFIQPTSRISHLIAEERSPV